MNDAVMLFVSAFGVSALAGLAALLRTDTTVTTKSTAAAVLNSGVLGLGISMLWYTKFRENPYFLVGVCVIVGLTGTGGMELAMEAIRRGGLSVKFGAGDEGGDSPPKEGGS